MASSSKTPRPSSSTNTFVLRKCQPATCDQCCRSTEAGRCNERYKTSLLEAVVTKEQLSLAYAPAIIETRKLETANDSARLAKMEMDSINAQFGIVDVILMISTPTANSTPMTCSRLHTATQKPKSITSPPYVIEKAKAAIEKKKAAAIAKKTAAQDEGRVPGDQITEEMNNVRLQDK